DPDYRADEEEDLYIHLNPFKCTHAYIREGIVERHGHEYQRTWEMDALPGRELLDVCAEIYGKLSALVGIAHEQLGAHMVSMSEDPATPIGPGLHRLPCMNDTEAYRTVRTYVLNGQEIWDGAPPHQ